PVSIGLAAVARPLILLMYTETWAGAIPFMQLTCLMLMFYPIHTCNLQLMNSMGRSDLFLKLEIIKKVLWVVILVVTVPMGIYPMVWGSVVNSVICLFINAWPNKKLMNYGPFEQLRDILPTLLLTAGMGIAAMSVLLLNLNNFVTLVLQILVGVAVYGGGAWLFKFESLTYGIDMAKKLIAGKRG
ncbi:MAG: polysaccharide biosynthesis C-terminal domain-containing protein, partial [Oscillospiraceae bacterium]|nr:polysaccharide biosynthesis C-terminal domain-containing protein [Oscillospiraceae bacterium]